MENFESMFGSVISKFSEKELPVGLAKCRPMGFPTVCAFFGEERRPDTDKWERHCIWV